MSKENVLDLEYQRNVKRTAANDVSIKELAISFAEKAYKTRSKTDLVNLWSSEYKKLTSSPYFYSSNTVRTYATVFYRKELVKRYNVDFSLKYRDLMKLLKTTNTIRIKQFIWLYVEVKLPYDEKVAIDKSYESKLFKRAEKTQEISNITNMIDLAKSNLKSEYYSKVALSLCFLTGRRPVEILKTSKFRKVSKYEIEFNGKVKTKRKASTKYEKIFCLVDSDLVIEGLKYLRKLRDYKGKSNIEVHDSTSKTLHNMVQKLFNFGFNCECSGCQKRNKKAELTKEEKIAVCHRLKPYFLRYAYAKICQYVFISDNSTTNFTIASILRHNENDMTSSHAYQDLVIKKSEEQKLKEYFNDIFPDTSTSEKDERINKLDQLLEQGLLTKQDYDKLTE